MAVGACIHGPFPGIENKLTLINLKNVFACDYLHERVPYIFRVGEWQFHNSMLFLLGHLKDDSLELCLTHVSAVQGCGSGILDNFLFFHTTYTCVKHSSCE